MSLRPLSAAVHPAVPGWPVFAGAEAGLHTLATEVLDLQRPFPPWAHTVAGATADLYVIPDIVIRTAVGYQSCSRAALWGFVRVLGRVEVAIPATPLAVGVIDEEFVPSSVNLLATAARAEPLSSPSH